MTDAPLFDCSPRMAAKLARCAEIARVQSGFSGHIANTNRDTTIFSQLAARNQWNRAQLLRWLRNLNA